MKILMNKQLYNFTQKLLQKHRQGGQIKSSALLIKLHNDYNFGQFDVNERDLTFTLNDIIILCEEIQSTLGLDIRSDVYPSEEDRLNSAKKFRNEKDNSYAISKDFILINSLTELKINRTCQKISPITSLGMYVKADDIYAIEHSAIILVENLTVMANLSLINLTDLSTEFDLTQALWLYRGDVKLQQTTHSSYHFFRRFKDNIPLICFSDLDPKGIEIALTSHADYWLTIKNIDAIAIPLIGSEQEWYKQGASISFLQEQLDKIPVQEGDCWQKTFITLREHRKTLKQEHMLKHNIGLSLLELLPIN